MSDQVYPPVPGDVARKVAAHNEKWSGLPWIAGKSELPAMDGDLALLHHLRDEIETALVTIPDDPYQVVNYLEVIAGSVEYQALLHVGGGVAESIPWPEHVHAGLAHQGQVIAAWKQALDADRQYAAEDEEAA